jgi:endoglycosylceramidase
MEDSLNSEDMANLQKWGMNHVRLGVMWEAVENVMGFYDQEYLSQVEKLINKLGEYGIYTMIDAHQDVMSRMTCGEGMPDFYAKQVIDLGKPKCNGDWTTDAFKPVREVFGTCRSIKDLNYKTDANGWPKIEECNKDAFFKYYTLSESQGIFDALYTNKHELTDAFVEYWGEVAKRLSKNPYVIGFDPINEPFPADIGEDPSLLEPGVFCKKKLAPLYEKVFKEYKLHNPNTIMYFEPG